MGATKLARTKWNLGRQVKANPAAMQERLDAVMEPPQSGARPGSVCPVGGGSDGSRKLLGSNTKRVDLNLFCAKLTRIRSPAPHRSERPWLGRAAILLTGSVAAVRLWRRSRRGAQPMRP